MRPFSNTCLHRVLLAAVALALLAAGALHANLLPVFGWDVLGDWNIEWGRPFRALVLLEMQAEAYSKYNYDMFRHSDLVTLPFVIAILFFDDYAGQFCALLWLLCALTIGIAIAKGRGEREFPLIFLILFLTVPLVENHYLIFGYSELWVSIFLLFLILLFLSDTASTLKICSVFVMLALLNLAKSSGIIYTLALSYAVAVFTIQSRFFFSSRVWLIFEGCCFLFVFAMFYRLGIEGFFELTGRNISLTTNPPAEVLINLSAMLFLNQSFTILPLMAFMCFVYSTSNIKIFFIKRFLVASLLIVVAGMGFTEPFFLHSQIGSDTSGSRFLLVLVAPAAYLVSLSFREFFSYRTDLDSRGQLN